ALSAVAFLAVYREGFETILFYKALFTSAGASGVSVVAGIAAGVVGLVAIYFLINQLGLRVAMKPFFAVTGAMLYYMAFVIEGRGRTRVKCRRWRVTCRPETDGGPRARDTTRTAGR